MKIKKSELTHDEQCIATQLGLCGWGTRKSFAYKQCTALNYMKCGWRVTSAGKDKLIEIIECENDQNIFTEGEVVVSYPMCQELRSAARWINQEIDKWLSVNNVTE